MPLYTDLVLQKQVQEILQATAKREGWLLSGMSIRQVSPDAVDIFYRSYFRGSDTVECYSISYRTGSLATCDAF